MSLWEIPWWLLVVALMVRNDYIEGHLWWNRVRFWRLWKD